MPLAPGTRLGPYEILAPLGAGGMGEVYRARDPRLQRDVAIKVLPAELRDDATARARQLREARIAATLNHPNICTIHEVGEADGHVYLAMELIDGRPLSEKIAERPMGLPLESVTRYGAQIAAALAHAHDKHVIHRDLKGSNVLVTRDGSVKVLDFGLARRTWEAPDAGGETLSVRLTETGTVMGTPQYLAPEVLRGAEADERSDIWALGVLLHEMSCGELPFKGGSRFELASAILHATPAALPDRVPMGLQGCVRRCLAKEPGERYARASEVRAALEALQSGPAAAIVTPAKRPSRTLAIALAGLALAVAVVAVWYLRRSLEPPRELQQRQLTSNTAGDPAVAGVISPDGKSLAVVDRHGLSLRSIESGESHPVELPAGFSFTPPLPSLCWFPDGSQLLLSGRMADGHPVVWALPVAGGRTHKVLDDASLAVLSPDGNRIAYERRGVAGTEVWICGLNGEGARHVTGDDSSGVIPYAVVWSPNGKRLAYARWAERAGARSPRLESCDLSGRARAFYTPPAEQPIHLYTVPAWLPDGRVVFGLTDPPPSQRDINLWSLRVDPRTGAPTGSPRRVTQWQRLALVTPTAYSAGGKRLSVAVLEYQSDIYVGRVDRPDLPLEDIKRLTLDDRNDLAPAWTADGSAVLFTSDRGGTFDVYRQRIDAANPEPVVTAPGDQYAPRQSPDGAWILYRDEDAASPGAAPLRSRIMRVPAAGGPSQQLLEVAAALTFRCPTARGASPVLCEFRNGEVVFAAFDPLQGLGRELVREKAQAQPLWDLSPDGRTIAVVDPSQEPVTALRLLSTVGAPATTLRFDQPIELASISYASDGRSWLVVEAGDQWRLLRVDARGRATPLIPPQLWMYTAAASPDGKHIAYTSNTGNGNIWMLEDF